MNFLKLKAISLRSSLFYNTSARHEQHKCETSNKSVTRVKQKQHEYDTNDTIARRVKNEGLQGEEQFHCKNGLMEMLCSHAKMCLKSAP